MKYHFLDIYQALFSIGDAENEKNIAMNLFFLMKYHFLDMSLILFSIGNAENVKLYSCVSFYNDKLLFLTLAAFYSPLVMQKCKGHF